jgi:hypothetical protein
VPRPRPEPLAAETLLRYRFDTQDQLLNHLHVVDDQAVMFFRDEWVAFPKGHRVYLEAVVLATSQQIVLRGQVLGDQGRTDGAWLLFPDARLCRRMAAAPLTSRRHSRLPTDLVAQFKGRSGGASQLCRLADVSFSGARVSGLFTAVDAGEVLDLRFPQPPPGIPSLATLRAEVLRTSASEATVLFLRDHAGTRMLADKLLASIQQSWLQARELTHPPVCCHSGGVLEPPLPRLRPRLFAG